MINYMDTWTSDGHRQMLTRDIASCQTSTLLQLQYVMYMSSKGKLYMSHLL